MKLSSNLIGMLIFAILAIAVFVLLAMRPAIQGNAMVLGMPSSSSNSIEGNADNASTMTNDSIPAKPTNTTMADESNETAIDKNNLPESPTMPQPVQGIPNN